MGNGTAQTLAAPKVTNAFYRVAVSRMWTPMATA